MILVEKSVAVIFSDAYGIFFMSGANIFKQMI
jgi:hypothetical protein